MATDEKNTDEQTEAAANTAPAKPAGMSEERARYIAALVKGEESPPHESMTLEYLIRRAHEVQAKGEEVLQKIAGNNQVMQQLQQETAQLRETMNRHMGAMDNYAQDIDEWLRKAEEDNLVDLKEAK